MQFKTHGNESVSLSQIKEACKNPHEDVVYYFNDATKEENMEKLKDSIEALGRSVYVSKLSSTDKLKFIYSVHIV